MAVNRSAYSTRYVSLVLLAALGGLAMWLFVPWGQGGSSGSSGGGSQAGASLPPSLKVDGTVNVEQTGNVITKLVVPLALRGNDSIVLVDDDGGMRAETALSDTAAASVPATYALAWLDGNGDRSLDPGEHARLTVTLPVSSSIHPGQPLSLRLHDAQGGTLLIEDVLP